MLRITRTEASNIGVVLKLEGRLLGLWVDELAQVAEPPLTSGHPVTLDLEHVTFLDSRGVRLLQDLEARGCAIVNHSLYVEGQLRREVAS